jgi:hypothetical protein
MRRKLRVKAMLHSAPDGARLERKFVEDQFGSYDLLGVGCCDWSDPDCQVWVYIHTGQFARADRAARSAEIAAVRAAGWAAAAEEAYCLALTTADAAAVAQVAEASRAAYASSEEAYQEADAAHDAALAAADAVRDVDRAAAQAAAARAAAARAEEAARAAHAACAAAKEAARAAGVSDSDICESCGRAADDAQERVSREFRNFRHQRMPRWRTTGYAAGHFGGEPRQALEALEKEYLGARV